MINNIDNNQDVFHVRKTLDPQLWVSGSARIVQRDQSPIMSVDKPSSPYIKYRGFYYTPNATHSHLMLKSVQGYPNPFVTCCNSNGFYLFMNKVNQGHYSNIDFEVSGFTT